MSQITTIDNQHHLSITRIDESADLVQAENHLINQSLNEAEVNILLGEEPRPLFHQTNDTDFVLVLRGINFDGDDDKSTVSLRMSNHVDHLFVAHRKKVKSLDELIDEFDKFSTTEELILDLVEKLTEKIEKHIFDLEEQIEAIEDDMLDHPSQESRHAIMKTRKKVIELRRYLLPQREVLNQLARNNLTHTDEAIRHQFTDLQQRTSRICDLLDALRERLGLIQEEIGALLSDKLNRNLYILSIISAIFLPLGFLTGLLGINVGGMPGADQSDAFWFVCALSLIIGLMIFLFFKSKKWI